MQEGALANEHVEIGQRHAQGKYKAKDPAEKKSDDSKSDSKDSKGGGKGSSKTPKKKG